MTDAPQIIYRRQRRREIAHRNPLGKLAIGCSMVMSLLIVFGGLLVAFAYARLTSSLPSIEILPALLEPPDGLYLQPTRLYDRSGEHLLLILEHPAAAEKQYLHGSTGSEQEDSIPEELQIATLAASDPHFWEHGGAPLVSLLQGERATLAKRLATDMLLQGELPGIQRALRAQILGTQITSRFGRTKVLEWYLNSANYGRLAYGADAAARVYFGKPADQLSLAEAAMLAATSEAPELNPMDAPQAALEQQKRLIQDMLRYRMIMPEEGIQAARETLVYRDPARQGHALNIQELEPGLAHAFSRLVLMQLETVVPRSRLERGGINIITTLDYDLQIQANCLSQVQRARLAGGKDSSEGALPECESARLLPTLSDLPAAPINQLGTDIVVLNPNSAEILAMVGQPPIGPEPGALGTHAAGSLSTPFLYLTAFARGLSPASLVWDIPSDLSPPEIRNFDSQFHGPMRLRIALANDYLVPASKVLTQVGANNVRRTLRQFALSIPISNESASPLALLEEADLLSASQAFGIFANQGVLVGRSLNQIQEDQLTGSPAPLHPQSVRLAKDLEGSILVDWTNPQQRPIITPQLAYLITDIMSDESARWPSMGHPNPLEVGRPAAAKLSRTYEGSSHWAIGYTPQLVVGVWLGTNDEQQAPQSESQAKVLSEAVSGLWHATLQFAHKDLPYQTWELPDGIRLIEVCDPSGQLPTKSCPNTVGELFLSGNEPIQGDTLYQSIPINREIIRLATVFTAPELVDEHVYMIVPPEADQWAEETGLERPPDIYETIAANLPRYGNATITDPSMFDLVHGIVDITGSAGGEDFQFYRLQVGQGMYPTQWLQIGQDVYQATSGQLASWDTRELSGLYTVQLLVVNTDNSLERSNVLVTVDNQPPDVRITAPVNDAVIHLDAREKIVLNAEIEDEIGIQSVVFYMDDEILDTRFQPPFVVSWQPETGEHHLRVVATDMAGNTHDDDIIFIVE